MAKSKFFGYVLRNAGTPCQQWVLNEIPTTVTSVFTSTTTSSVAINGIIPVSSVVINQIGGKVNSDGSFSLPCGLYKISFSTDDTYPIRYGRAYMEWCYKEKLRKKFKK